MLLPHLVQASVLCLARPLRQRRRAAPQPPAAHFISAGGEGGEAAFGEVVGSGEFSGSLGSGSGSGARATARQEGWQRRWGMVAMCFVAFMVRLRCSRLLQPWGVRRSGVQRRAQVAVIGGPACLLQTPNTTCSPSPPLSPTPAHPLPPLGRSCATWTA